MVMKAIKECVKWPSQQTRGVEVVQRLKLRQNGYGCHYDASASLTRIIVRKTRTRGTPKSAASVCMCVSICVGASFMWQNQRLRARTRILMLRLWRSLVVVFSLSATTRGEKVPSSSIKNDRVHRSATAPDSPLPL